MTGFAARSRSVRPVLGAAEVDVWRVALPGVSDPADWAVLSRAEREKAERLRYRTAEQDYVVAHAALRRVLALYQGEPPGALRFAVGEHGKPELLGTATRFSLTHTAGLALVAVTGGLPVGVDAEAVAGDVDVAGLSARVLTPSEADRLSRRPVGDRRRSFLRHWTGKESYLKGLGTGLTVPPDSFEVRFDRRGRGRVASPDGGPLAGWRLRELLVGPAHVGVVALAGVPRRVRLLAWTGNTPLIHPSQDQLLEAR